VVHKVEVYFIDVTVKYVVAIILHLIS